MMRLGKTMKKMATNLVLENKNYSFSINLKELRITSLFNKQTNDEYIKFAFPMPIFFIKGLLDKELIQCNPLYSSHTDDSIYVKFDGYEVYADIHFVCDQSDQLKITIAVENCDKHFRVTEIVGPNLYGLQLGKDYKKNVFIYPHHAGEKTVNPVDRYKKEDYQNFWRAKTSLTNYNTYHRQINYCGLASMTFMYLYDQANGLYFGSHDLNFPVTGVVAEVGSQENFMGLSYVKYHDLVKQEIYESGEYVISVNTKDWHYAKELYRNYLTPHLKFHNYPDYLDDQWGLNQCYNFKRQGNIIQNTFKNIPTMYEEGKKHGLNHMFIASWNRGGFDTDYPEYYPDMDLGSAMDFVRGLEYVREHGGIPTLYINARIFELGSDYAPTVGEKMAMKDVAGNNYIETYGIKSFTISCPSDQEWANRLLDTAEFLIKGYGTTGIYLDQLASAEPFPCYQKEHSHRHIGEFNRGYLEVLAKLHDKIKKYGEDKFILTENIGDIYSSYTFGNLTWNGPKYDEYFNVIKYIFPEFIQINMVNPKNVTDFSSSETKEFIDQMERAIVLGSILWFAPTRIKFDPTNEVIRYAYQALNFRSKLQPLIKHATYKDDIYFVNLNPKLRGSVFEEENGYLIIIGNQHGMKEKVTVQVTGKLIEAKNFQLEDISQSVNITTNEVVIQLTSNLAYIYISKQR